MSKVYLIGAGPGDEELITVKAVRLLEKCTAVMYDRLAGEGTLKYLNENCEIYYCGKEPGCHYKTQDEINDMLVELAKKGHTVGRIKGGDPYIFGRGGEEALRLIDEGIDFQVIPGITSPISVLNYAGIPMTHRKIAQSFHVFTGRSAEKLNMNWDAAAKIGGTLVFLMGYENLGVISSNLMESGMDANTPCAVVMRGTTSKQKKVTGTLENIKETAQQAALHSPCIIVVGDVVGFNDKLNWYEKLPLFGQNVCITRTKEQAKEMKERLIDLGAQVTEINSIQIRRTSENLDSYLENLSEYQHVVFTSVNGVNAFFDHLMEKDVDIRCIKAKFSAIGPATRDAIKKRGIVPSIVAEKFVAEDLFEAMKSQVKAGEKILIPRARDARPFLVNALKECGCIVDEVHMYDTLCGDAASVENFKDADSVVFTSPSTVKNMISMVGAEGIRSKNVVAIGPITAKELQKNEISCSISDEYSMDGVVDKLQSH